VFLPAQIFPPAVPPACKGTLIKGNTRVTTALWQSVGHKQCSLSAEGSRFESLNLQIQLSPVKMKEKNNIVLHVEAKEHKLEKHRLDCANIC
jgi:hypothetical protein